MNALDEITRTLGQPQALRQIQAGPRARAAVARWRHGGAFVDLSAADTYRLIFNISGGQIVELHSRENVVRHSIRAGSIAIVCPGDFNKVTITGEADTLQFFMTEELIMSVTGSRAPVTRLQLLKCEPELRAAAARAIVALGRSECQDVAEWEAIVASIACRFAQPAVLFGDLSRGGLSPGAIRRVGALIERQLGDAPSHRLSLGDLAAAAGLSIHHFIKAFRRSQGTTPYAHVIANRLDKALTLLLRKDARVGQVADDVGFSSPAHFVSAFRKHVGITPGALLDAAHSLDRN